MKTPSPATDEMPDDLTPTQEPVTFQGMADRWPVAWYGMWACTPAVIALVIVMTMMFPGPQHPLLDNWERVASVLIAVTVALGTYWARLLENDPRPRMALRQVARLVYGDYAAEVLPGLVISPDGSIQARVFVGGPWRTNPGRILGIEIVPIICPGFPVPSDVTPSAGDPLGHHRAHDDWECAGAQDWPTTHNLRDLPKVERASSQQDPAGSAPTLRIATDRHAVLTHPDGTVVPMRRPGDVDLAAREIGLGRGRGAELLEEDDLVAELLEAFDQDPAPNGRSRPSGVGRLLKDLLAMDQAGEFTIVPRPDHDDESHEDAPRLQAIVPTKPGLPLGDPLARGMGLPEDRPSVRARRGHLELLD